MEFFRSGLRLCALLSNGLAFLLNQQNNLAKYISIPHTGVKFQKISSDQKTNNTNEFVVSNFPKNIVSTPQFESGTFSPMRNFVFIFVPGPVINSWENVLFSLSHPYSRTPLVLPPMYWLKKNFK